MAITVDLNGILSGLRSSTRCGRNIYKLIHVCLVLWRIILNKLTTFYSLKPTTSYTIKISTVTMKYSVASLLTMLMTAGFAAAQSCDTNKYCAYSYNNNNCAITTWDCDDCEVVVCKYFLLLRWSETVDAGIG